MTRLKKRVLLVDHTLALKNELDQMDETIQSYVVVGVFSNVRDAYLSLLRNRADIIVVSLHQSDQALLKTIGKIKNQYPSIDIIVQSELEDDGLFLDLLSIGVAGFIPHQKNWADLEKHLNDIVNGYLQTKHSMREKDQPSEVFHLKFSTSTNRLEIARLIFSDGPAAQHF
jgi:DNA-binding NarL/FixJ family response regulator